MIGFQHSCNKSNIPEITSLRLESDKLTFPLEQISTEIDISIGEQIHSNQEFYQRYS